MAQTCALPGMPQVPAALILTLGAIYNLRTRKPVNTIYGCICPNCRHRCILHVDGRSLNKAIRLWNHHASHHQRNEQ